MCLTCHIVSYKKNSEVIFYLGHYSNIIIGDKKVLLLFTLNSFYLRNGGVTMHQCGAVGGGVRCGAEGHPGAVLHVH